MNNFKYVKHEHIDLRNLELNEKWVQDRIAEDPSILGLGKLILKGRERIQHKAGRLDLLFQDPYANRRYEVEVQLGTTDESHIIRTIEYWDHEKKHFPEYDHIAVIVAEDITSRFLNVISLFNGLIPLVAIQMNALKNGDQISLVFTKVLNQMPRRLDEEEEGTEGVDRAYWEKMASKETVSFADKMLELIHSFEPSLELKYNKIYIGLAQNGQPKNFVIFRPQKNAFRFEIRIAESDDIEKSIQDKGIDIIDYTKSGRYRMRLLKSDVEKHSEFLKELLMESYHQETE